MAKKEQELTASMIDTFREFKETKNIDRRKVSAMCLLRFLVVMKTSM